MRQGVVEAKGSICFLKQVMNDWVNDVGGEPLHVTISVLWPGKNKFHRKVWKRKN